MAWIVGFISQKGGVGKSTKARALAREASACGIKTKLAEPTSVSWFTTGCFSRSIFNSKAGHRICRRV